MKKNDRQSIVGIAKFVNFLFVLLIFAFVWFRHYNTFMDAELTRRLGIAIGVIYLVCYRFLVYTYEGLAVGTTKVSEQIFSQCLAFLFLDGSMFAVFWLLLGSLPAYMPIIQLLAIKVVFALIWSFIFDYLYFKDLIQSRSAIVYFDKRDYKRLSNLGAVSRRFRIEKILQTSQIIDSDFLLQLEDMDAVFVRGLPANQRNDILKYCMERGIEVYFWPKIGDVLISGARRINMFHVPVMHLQRYKPKTSYLFVKRAFDVLVSLIGIILLSPFMLITMYAIRFYDGGPVLYKQVRLTKDGKSFKILKFRSMRVDAEKDGIPRLSTGNRDSRVTPVGRVIRAIRFDELPQLFNILKGDMSIVGPRPERPEIAMQYEKEMPEFRLRLQTKAGLTGYAQVYGKYNTMPYDKLQMDLMYLTNPSFLNDIRIMLATVKILFQKESTEGVAQGQVTA